MGSKFCPFSSACVLLIYFLNFQLTQAQLVPEIGKTCAQSLAKYYPRQNLDMEKMLGEWPGIAIGWREKKHNIPPKYVCPSQNYTREANSPNLEILFKFRSNPETSVFTELHGVAEISRDNPALWRNVVFREMPHQSMDGIIIATDYISYAIGIECEIKDGVPVENFVLRSRTRVLGHEERKIFEGLVEGLGFPRENFIRLSQSSCLATHGKEPTRKIPSWSPQFQL